VALPNLPTGAYPLSRAQGFVAAGIVAVCALLLSFFAPVLARLGNVLVVPPDAVRFGAASLVPPIPEDPKTPGWRVRAVDNHSVTLTKGGVTVRAHTGVTRLGLERYLDGRLAAYPRSGLSEPGEQERQLGPVVFHCRGTATDGLIAWLEGTRRSAVLVVIPVYSSQKLPGTAFVEVLADGPTKAMEQLSAEIDAMLSTIRYGGGGS
jgi:hypothetical protein